MPSSPPSLSAVGLWTAAVVGAVAVLVGPLTPWSGPVEIIGLAICVAAIVLLTVWFLRQ